MTAEAAVVVRVVAATLEADVIADGGLAQIQRTVSKRVGDALSEVPARRVATAQWLIESSGREDPDALDLLVESAREAVRELAKERRWSPGITEGREARVEAALRTLANADQ